MRDQRGALDEHAFGDRLPLHYRSCISPNPFPSGKNRHSRSRRPSGCSRDESGARQSTHDEKVEIKHKAEVDDEIL